MMTLPLAFLLSRGAACYRRPAVALVAALVLTACGDKSAKDTPSDSAAMSATAKPADTAMAGMSGMDHNSMGAMTGNADQDFLRMMSDHHKGLIEIAHAAKDSKVPSEGVRADARKLDATQDAEIDSMVTMLETTFKDPYQPKVTPDNKTMADMLAAQSGASYGRTFYETIIKHHQQAVAMVDEFLPKLTRPELKAMAARMKADQTREIAEFQRKAGG